MKAVIFAGGVGTRLWPLSRKMSPKQFEKIIGDKSTLQLAALRLLPDFQWSEMYISTGKAYAEIVSEQLPEIPKDQIIGEPSMRDVGPAVGLITALLAKESPDEPMVILWSDHLVKNDVLFRKILKVAGELIHKKPDQIIFVSQKPRFASENLGWIEYGHPVITQDGLTFNAFRDFQYRPDTATAQKYLKSGRHAWNLGYFVTTPRFLLQQYERFAPNLFAGLKTIGQAWKTKNYTHVLEKVYPTLESIAFDNAILEKLDPESALVISENIGWSDIGAWEALKEALEHTDDKNVTKGKVLLTDTRDTLAYNYTDQVIAIIDLDGYVVVNTPDILLITQKKSVPKIKEFVKSLEGTQHENLA